MTLTPDGRWHPAGRIRRRRLKRHNRLETNETKMGFELTFTVPAKIRELLGPMLQNFFVRNLRIFVIS